MAAVSAQSYATNGIVYLIQTSSGPARPPVTSPPVVGRWLRWGSILGRFASVQVIVQAVNAVTGLLLVRLLDKHDFALFTIASSMQAMLNLLTDCGINAGLFSIGGRVWRDREDMGRLIETALRLRRQLSIVAVLVVSPISLWLLLTNGASVTEAAVLTAVVVGTVHFTTAVAVFGVVTKLHSRYAEIQRVDLAGALSRLGMVLAAAAIFVNALLAAAAASISQIVQFFLVRRQAIALISADQPNDSGHRRDLLAMIKGQAFYFVFYALQGQLSVVLISTLGSSGQVADIGALSRLGLISGVLGAVINQVIAPAFARIRDRRHLGWTFVQALLLTLLFGLGCIAIGRVFAPQILWLFGTPYSHLSAELVWMMVSIALGLVLAIIWALNTARGWLHATWLMVPLTLATQVALTRWLDLATVRGVLLFSILAQLPNLLVSAWLSVRGFVRFEDHTPGPPAVQTLQA